MSQLQKQFSQIIKNEGV